MTNHGTLGDLLQRMDVFYFMQKLAELGQSREQILAGVFEAVRSAISGSDKDFDLDTELQAREWTLTEWVESEIEANLSEVFPHEDE